MLVLDATARAVDLACARVRRGDAVPYRNVETSASRWQSVSAMKMLSAAELDFAKSHIETFGDSDFYPRPPAYEALWADWDSVRDFMSTRGVDKLPAPLCRALPAPKANGGYRIAHQLDPIAALAYTALAQRVAPVVEAARMPAEKQSVFSYRIALDDRSFFKHGSGYGPFVQQCRQHAKQHQFVLVADLADFYNRIYVHRLQNNLVAAGAGTVTANAIETFLMRVNLKASQGIPVGPAASIILAEATLTDVDALIADADLAYVRYVDDLRVFADDRDVLTALLEKLVLYLHEHHRLQFAWGKTTVLPTAELLARIDAPDNVEQRTILGIARDIADYSVAYDDADAPDLVRKYMEPDPPRPPKPAKLKGRAKTFAAVLEALRRAQDEQKRVVRRRALEDLLSAATSGPLDLGLARYVLRRSKALHATEILDLVIAQFAQLLPACPDVFLYLEKMRGSAEYAARLDQLAALRDAEAVKSSQFVRHWLHWFYSTDAALAQRSDIRKYMKSAAIEHQAGAAQLTKNVSWIRGKKTQIGAMGGWDKWATIAALAVLPREERQPVLRALRPNGPPASGMDDFMIDWVLGQP